MEFPDGLTMHPGCLQDAKEFGISAVIADTAVYDLFGVGLGPHIVIPQGEAAKTLETAELCWRQLAAWKVGRDGCILALGGGACLDLAGFVASTYLRGIPCIYVPTTLLAMVDAAIGGKTAINLPEGKNLVGCFQLPKKTLVDPLVLKTLPQREFNAGFAELIKTAFIDGPTFFYNLNNLPIETLIKRAMETKWRIVSEDFRDNGLRAQLNFGHSFAHALEAMGSYKNLMHGEAVAIGMSAELHLSQLILGGDFRLIEEMDEELERADLPNSLPELDLLELIKYMRRDKKNTNGEITCILAQDVGKVFPRHAISSQQIEAALKQKRAWDAEKRKGVSKQCLNH